MDRPLRSGPGWRLGWAPNASKFQGLVGGDDWAIELTKAEFADFCRLLDQLVTTMNQMTDELMDEEAIACEAESDLLWMEVQGYPQAFRLSFILLSGRRAEGQWSAPVVPELVQAVRVLQF